jgi:hypothetical protein
MGSKSLKVQLTLVDTSKVNSINKSKAFAELKKYDLYGYMKVLDFAFRKGEDQKWDENTTLTWYIDPLTKIKFFRIKLTNRTKNVTRINKLLEEYHLSQIRAYHECVDGAPFSGEYGFDASLTYLSEYIVSFHCTSGYYCGGAHPDGGEWGKTFDCNSLKELNLSDLYWFDDIKNYTENSTANQDDKMIGFDEVWHAIVKSHYGEIKIDVNECEFTPDVWSKYTFVLTKEGLHVGAYFPRVARNCDTGLDWPIIPYSKIEAYRVNKKRYSIK